MRRLSDISIEIKSSWKNIKNKQAIEALDDMKDMGLASDAFFLDGNGYAVIGSFLCSSRGWQGETARRIKKELRMMCEKTKSSK